MAAVVKYRDYNRTDKLLFALAGALFVVSFVGGLMAMFSRN